MGVLDDMGRIWDASKGNPRPGLVQGIGMAADAAEAAKAMQANGVPQGLNGQSFNPFENMQGMAAATRGTGTVAKLTDTGEKFAPAGQPQASIYDVTLDVVSDTQAPFQVVHRQMIAAAALGNWQVGKTLPVRFDPANLTQVTIG